MCVWARAIPALSTWMTLIAVKWAFQIVHRLLDGTLLTTLLQVSPILGHIEIEQEMDPKGESFKVANRIPGR